MARNICTVGDCGEFVVGRGMCRKHYMRWKRHGDPNHVTPRSDWGPRSDVPPLEERFWANVEKRANGCWVWTGHRIGDYGSIGDGGRSHRAHRVSYEMLVGPIPEGLVIDHLCRNPPCVNPAHLEPVTNGENVRRGDHQNRRKTHCKHGHPFDEENTVIKKDGRRACKECGRRFSREFQRKKRREYLLAHDLNS